MKFLSVTLNKWFNLGIIPTLIFAFLLTLFLPACQKDDPKKNTEAENLSSFFNVDKKTGSISSSAGGRIELKSGIILDVPSQALSSNIPVTVENRNPFLFYSDQNLKLEEMNVSSSVLCTPEGLKFNKPVKITIRYYTELIPSGNSVNDLIVLSTNQNSIDTLKIVSIDQTNKTITAETNHFSEFVIKVKNSSWVSINSPGIGQNNTNNTLTLSFTNMIENNFWTYLAAIYKLETASIVNQELWYEVGLFRKKTLATDEFITGKQVYKGCVAVRLTDGKKIIKGTRAEDKSFYRWGEFPNLARLGSRNEIFNYGNYDRTEVELGASNEVFFDANKNVTNIIFRDLGENIGNETFLKNLTVDAKNLFLEIIKLNLLSADYKYYFKIRIQAFGKLRDSYGTYESSTFKITDVNKVLSENQKPVAKIISPTNNSIYSQGQDITFSGDASDFEDESLPTENIVWSSDKDGTFNLGLTNFKYNKLSVNKHVIKLTVYDLDGNSSNSIINLEVKQNSAPSQPTNPNPANNSTGITNAPTLSWNCSDPDGDAITYDIYYGTNNPPTTNIGSAQTNNSILKSGLSNNTTYYWQVNAKDSKGNTTNGTVWKFTTSTLINQPPGALSNPNPSDNATSVSTSPILTWACTDPEGDALTYDVYFGTTDSPSKVASDQNSTSLSRSNLSAGNLYYWKIVAKDNKGNSTTGPIWKFTTLSVGNFETSTQPYNGYTYKTVKIGTQWWFSENLQTTKYNDGTSIPNVTNNSSWANLITGAYCWYNNSSATYQNTYGALYNWWAVNSGKLCPSGWHVPSLPQWQTFFQFLINNGYGYGGSGNDVAKSLSAKTNWMAYSSTGTPGNDLSTNNSSGFSALPAGIREVSGAFSDVGYYAIWFSSTEYDSDRAWIRQLNYDNAYFGEDGFKKVEGLSVRCLKNSEPDTNKPPLAPSSPNPSNNATGISATLSLNWECTDPDGDAITFDVYFGTTNPPLTKISSAQTAQNIARSGLSDNTSYFWLVNAKDSKGNSTTGQVWKFTTVSTINQPPLIPSNPSPANNATSISTTLSLNWECSDPEGDAITYDVYFGTTNPPITKIGSAQSAKNIARSGLSNNITYYWQVNAKDSKGNSTIGSVWGFTTLKGAGPIANFNSSKNFVYMGEEILFNDLTINNPRSWQWDFGDYDISNVQNPTKAYMRYGLFNVKLKVANEYGTDEKIIPNFITVLYSCGKNITGSLTYSGKTYKTVIINNKEWMAENLAYLPKINSPSEMSLTETLFYVYGYYGNNITEVKSSYQYVIKGVLYNWEAAKSACPPGWHLPSTDEWNQLSQFISDQKGPYSKVGNIWNGVGKHLKSTYGWNPSITDHGNGTDDFCFSGLPAGGLNYLDVSLNYDFNFSTINSYWWTSTNKNDNEAYKISLWYGDMDLRQSGGLKAMGFSVRCIKN